MPRTWPLVGRGDEVRAAAAAVRAGAGAVVTGPPGVGRSRVLAEVVHALDARRYAVLRVRGSGARPAAPGPRAGADGAVSAVRGRAGTRRAVLCVDDAHLLDAAAVAAVHRLVTGREALLLAAVRDGEPVAPRFEALWTGGGRAGDRAVRLLPLRPLDGAAVRVLVECTLGDVVDCASLRRLHELTRGDLVLLREVLRDARATGALHRRHGVWQWPPAPGQPGPVLHRLPVERRLAELDDRLRGALELVALGEPLELALVDRLGIDDALTELEHLGLVALHDDGVRPAHPLQGEAARAGCPPLRTRRHYRALAAALAELTAGDPAGPVTRLARWEVDGGRAGDPARLVAAAREAITRGDVPLAERLARVRRRLGRLGTGPGHGPAGGGPAGPRSTGRPR